MDNLAEIIPLGARAVLFSVAAAVLFMYLAEIERLYDAVYINYVNEHSIEEEDYYE
ncbi:MAG: hypothetical protein K6G40_07860 [Eubacterium sp.]|nr:hypothetical protein [Eubacterium sp.]